MKYQKAPDYWWRVVGIKLGQASNLGSKKSVIEMMDHQLWMREVSNLRSDFSKGMTRTDTKLKKSLKKMHRIKVEGK